MSYLSELRKIVGHRPLLSAGATVLVIKDGKILLNLRSDTETWGIPGGGLELGECLEETAFRELRRRKLNPVRLKFKSFGTLSRFFPCHTPV
ncbi:MAG: NUDIX domain-containing protein [Clostridia bacterium]|nr:NUDIX domain-containing protein [Clostridia bacterium]